MTTPKPPTPIDRSNAESSISNGLTQELRLRPDLAASWLRILNRALAEQNQDDQDSCALRNRLEEQCWLARWKREYVIIEASADQLANYANALVQASNMELSEEELHVIEAIITHLALRRSD